MKNRFIDRGLSPESIDSLTAHGIEYPEQLLSLSDAQLRKMGVLHTDVARYLERFRSWTHVTPDGRSVARVEAID